MGSSSPTQTPIQSQTQTKDPWAPSQPFIQQAMENSAGLYNQGAAGGYQPYPGSMMGDVHPWQQQGQGAAMNLAASEPTGSAALHNARDYANQMITDQGLNAGMRGAAGQFQDIYNELTGNENPYLQEMLAASNRQIADKVNSATSGAGRYGSAAHTDVLGRSLAEAANPMLAADYEARQGRRMQATGSLADLYNTGIQNAGKFAQLIPGLDEARFANSARMMDLGQFYTNRAQTEANTGVSQWNATQAFPWENLARYNAIVQGAGGLGGTQVGALSGYINQPTTMQKMFGGGLAGAGIGGSFGGAPGAAAGAGIGGLLGMM